MTSPKRFTVLVADKVAHSGLGPLTNDDRFDVVFGAEMTAEELGAALAEADGLVVRSATKVTDELLAQAAGLKVIGRAGVGVDNIDLVAATARGIPVLNAPAGNTVSAAELTLALILSLVRRVPAADRSIRDGEWARSRHAGTELRGKTLGLVGAGRIGSEVARRARAFGMRILAFDPYLTDERAEELGILAASFDEVLGSANVVSLHVPLTNSTRGMIGRDELARMQSSAYLVNASRGGVVDEVALVDALQSGALAGAALDVFEVEPLPADSPLRDAPNLVLTPHLGASTSEAQELVAIEIASAIRAALLEGDLSRAVNAPAIGGKALQKLRPLLDLGERLGRLACALSSGGVGAVEVRLAGFDASALKPLSASVLHGLLTNILGEDAVNYVSALHLAEARDIEVITASVSGHPTYPVVLEVAVEASREGIKVAGALLGDHHPRIIRIGDYHVDVLPEGSLLVLCNRDVPGVIGKVGTLLGDHHLNIAEYHQARLKEGGDALAAVAIDGRVTEDVLKALVAMPEVTDARVAELG